MPAVKILVAQGGGPTAVINQSLVGVVLEARRFAAGRAGLRRAPRRARHRQRGLRRPDAGDQPQPRAGGGHAGLGARLDARQARPARTARRSSRCCRRTTSATSSTSAATTRRTPCASSARRPQAPAIRCAASTSPRPSTTTWSCNDHTPGLPVGGALRRAGLRRRQPRQRARCPASTSTWSWAATPAS